MIIDGSILRDYRNENNMTRDDLAQKVDLAPKTIQRIENGEPTKESTIKMIEDALGIKLSVKDEFTDAQRAAINYSAPNLKVLAGAGAGKTRVVEEIIAKKISEGMDPSGLIVCTFTDKAALELRVRIQQRMKQFNGAVGVAEITLGTIHGICMRLLQEYTDKYGDYSVLETMKNIHFINRYFKQIEMGNIKKIGSSATMDRYFDTNRFLSICSILDENQVDNDLVPNEIKIAYKNYRKLLNEYHYFDFSTIQSEFLHELREDQNFRIKLSEKVKLIIVDEFQDVNYLQNEIVKELSKMGIHVVVVGDADQAIYQFRGSNFKYIKEFEKGIPDTAFVKLEENFRSTEGIIQIAENSIVRNITREDKNMKSCTNWKYERGDIVYKKFDTPEEESSFIADRIEELIAMGMPANEIAVLFRKKKYMQSIIDELKKRNIPIEVENVSSLLETDEIKAITNVFKYLAGKADVDKNVVIQGFEVLEKYINKDSISEAIKYIDSVEPNIWMSNHPSSMNQEYLLQEIYQNLLGILGIIKDVGNDVRYEQILFNLGKFSQLLNDFEVIYYDYMPTAKIPALVGFLQGTKDEYPEGYLSDEYRKVMGVQIMTVHKSKGLQFSAVFIPTLVKNVFPSRKKGGLSEWHYLPEAAIKNASSLRGAGNRNLEDERRVFYVAVTRSRKFLFLTRAYYTEKKNEKDSEFLSEALSASGYIYEYDKAICNYIDRPKWKPFAADHIPFKVDFTELAEYFSCDYGFKLSKIYGFANPINLRMGYGLSIHNMAREINKYVLENKVSQIPDEKMQEIFDSFYLPFVGKAEKVNKVLAEKAVDCIKKYTLENAPKFKEVEYVEKYIEVPLGDDILVSGRIDLIRKKDIGGKWHVIIVDYKTGHKIPSELEQRLQLEIYALGYKQLKGENADSMEIVDIEGNKVISSRAVVEENLVKTTEMIEDACDAVLEGKIKNKSCEKQKCKNCSRKQMCYEE